MHGISRATAAKAGITTVAALALAGGLASAASAKAVTYTVTGSTSVSASSTGTPKFVDSTNGVTANCTSVSGSGTASVGTKVSAKKLGTITSSTFTGCSVIGIALNIKQVGTWTITGTGATSGGVTPVSLTKISSTVSGQCTLAAKGTLDGTFNNTNHELTLGAGNGSHFLTASKVGSGCLGAVSNGDHITFNLILDFPTATTITSN